MPVVAASAEAGVLRREGAGIAVRVYPPRRVMESLRRENRPVPCEKIQAIVDTGAVRSGADVGVIRALNIPSRNRAVIFTPSGRSMQFQYSIVLHIEELGLWREMTVFGLHLTPRPYHMLLGRDILSLGTLIYSGRTGHFEFNI